MVGGGVKKDGWGRGKEGWLGEGGETFKREQLDRQQFRKLVSEYRAKRLNIKLYPANHIEI